MLGTLIDAKNPAVTAARGWGINSRCRSLRVGVASGLRFVRRCGWVKRGRDTSRRGEIEGRSRETYWVRQHTGIPVVRCDSGVAMRKVQVNQTPLVVGPTKVEITRDRMRYRPYPRSPSNSPSNFRSGTCLSVHERAARPIDRTEEKRLFPTVLHTPTPTRVGLQLQATVGLCRYTKRLGPFAHGRPPSVRGRPTDRLTRPRRGARARAQRPPRPTGEPNRDATAG